MGFFDFLFEGNSWSTLIGNYVPLVMTTFESRKSDCNNRKKIKFTKVPLINNYGGRLSSGKMRKLLFEISFCLINPFRASKFMTLIWLKVSLNQFKSIDLV